jgi:hypothetical protein
VTGKDVVSTIKANDGVGEQPIALCSAVLPSRTAAHAARLISDGEGVMLPDRVPICRPDFFGAFDRVAVVGQKDRGERLQMRRIEE